MTVRLALVSCSTHRDLDGDLPLLVPALGAEGVEAEVVDWHDDGVRWEGFDAAVLRSTWDYTHHLDAFLAWVADTSTRTRLANPAPIIRWNTDKRYLRDLAASGVPIAPTVVVEPGETAAIPEEWTDVVVKPTVSAGARDTGRFTTADAASAHLTRLGADGRTALVQPYLPSVDAVGEIDTIVVGGRPVHAVRKRAVLTADVAPPPDERLAEHQVVEPVALADAPVALVEQVLAALAPIGVGTESPLYARIDAALDLDGEWVLMEAELVEPYLFLPLADHAVAPVAAAIAAWVRAT